jgi:hypothetical protein
MTVWRRTAATIATLLVAAAFSPMLQAVGPADDLVGGPVVRAEPATWQRLALNALLVPLLEPDGPLSWAAPNELMPCRDSAEVRLDGKPVPHGQPLPLHRPLVVRFRLDDCWPLGSDWIGLFGTVEMTIVHHGASVTATVRPRGLSAAADGARVPLRAEFVAEISLAPERRP